MYYIKQLVDFYHAYSDWVAAGATEGKQFSRHVGLCGSIFLYLAMKGCPIKDRKITLEMMRAQFVKARLDSEYPFNNQENSYRMESINGLIHTNRNRIAWVKKEWQHYV